jgi:homoserine O-acetyltransferase
LERQPEHGLGLARAIAMLSYRSMASLESKFGRERVSASRGLLETSFEIESYLAYQGVKLVKRFDANTYLYLTKAMDDYDLSEGRGRLEAVLAGMRLPALVMGIDSDVLYPEGEQQGLMEYLLRAEYAAIRSPHGHDAFLIEFSQVAVRLRRFLKSVS